ncbi:MAG TPA: class I SAM-dependent methyltransferase [Pyrinomonadaceae bacterium]|nr:class I SAM-dependent methyltransferase [Pyrinomonadaceae bacterium]
MNEVLQEIVRTGFTVLPSGENVKVTSHIDESCGELIQNVIRDIRPQVSVEVGLAFGISTLYILEALKETGGLKLIGMDPAQHDQTWRGGGLRNIQEAGYADLYEFHENTSQQVLPALVALEQGIGFAFIDGWHTFDHTLIDFFYIDQMLEPGGVVVFDDVGGPGIKRACDFILTNRNYEIYGAVRLNEGNGSRARWKSKLATLLDPVVRTDKTASLESRTRESNISDVYFLALRKRENDNRGWDHFVQF